MFRTPVALVVPGSGGVREARETRDDYDGPGDVSLVVRAAPAGRGRFDVFVNGRGREIGVGYERIDIIGARVKYTNDECTNENMAENQKWIRRTSVVRLLFSYVSRPRIDGRGI